MEIIKQEKEVKKIVEVVEKQNVYFLTLSQDEALFLRALLGNIPEGLGGVGEIAKDLRSALVVAGLRWNGQDLIPSSAFKFNFTSLQDLRTFYKAD